MKLSIKNYTIFIYALLDRHSRVSHTAHVHIQGINVGGGPNEDPVGHGTMVAGCAMSNTYGAAMQGTAIAVGIDRNGSPDTA